MRPGIRFGVDVGSVRVGVARSDASGSLAVPVATLRRGKGDHLVVSYWQRGKAEDEAAE